MLLFSSRISYFQATLLLTLSIPAASMDLKSVFTPGCAFLMQNRVAIHKRLKNFGALTADRTVTPDRFSKIIAQELSLVGIHSKATSAMSIGSSSAWAVQILPEGPNPLNQLSAQLKLQEGMDLLVYPSLFQGAEAHVELIDDLRGGRRSSFSLALSYQALVETFLYSNSLSSTLRHELAHIEFPHQLAGKPEDTLFRGRFRQSRIPGYTDYSLEETTSNFEGFLGELQEIETRFGTDVRSIYLRYQEVLPYIQKLWGKYAPWREQTRMLQEHFYKIRQQDPEIYSQPEVFNVLKHPELQVLRLTGFDWQFPAGQLHRQVRRSVEFYDQLAELLESVTLPGQLQAKFEQHEIDPERLTPAEIHDFAMSHLWSVGQNQAEMSRWVAALFTLRPKLLELYAPHWKPLF